MDYAAYLVAEEAPENIQKALEMFHSAFTERV
jgi:hypothetical protein